MDGSIPNGRKCFGVCRVLGRLKESIDLDGKDGFAGWESVPSFGMMIAIVKVYSCSEN